MSSKQLSDLELEVVQCINRLRTAPQSEEFSGYLQAELDSFAGDGRTINRTIQFFFFFFGVLRLEPDFLCLVRLVYR